MLQIHTVLSDLHPFQGRCSTGRSSKPKEQRRPWRRPRSRPRPQRCRWRRRRRSERRGELDSVVRLREFLCQRPFGRRCILRHRWRKRRQRRVLSAEQQPRSQEAKERVAAMEAETMALHAALAAQKEQISHMMALSAEQQPRSQAAARHRRLLRRARLRIPAPAARAHHGGSAALLGRRGGAAAHCGAVPRALRRAVARTGTAHIASGCSDTRTVAAIAWCRALAPRAHMP